MFLPKKRASLSQQWDVSVRLKMVRLSSFVHDRKAEAFFYFLFFFPTGTLKLHRGGF